MQITLSSKLEQAQKDQYEFVGASFWRFVRKDIEEFASKNHIPISSALRLGGDLSTGVSGMTESMSRALGAGAGLVAQGTGIGHLFFGKPTSQEFHAESYLEHIKNQCKKLRYPMQHPTVIQGLTIALAAALYFKASLETGRPFETLKAASILLGALTYGEYLRFDLPLIKNDKQRDSQKMPALESSGEEKQSFLRKVKNEIAERVRTQPVQTGVTLFQLATIPNGIDSIVAKDFWMGLSTIGYTAANLIQFIARNHEKTGDGETKENTTIIPRKVSSIPKFSNGRKIFLNRKQLQNRMDI